MVVNSYSDLLSMKIGELINLDTEVIIARLKARINILRKDLSFIKSQIREFESLQSTGEDDYFREKLEELKNREAMIQNKISLYKEIVGRIGMLKTIRMIGEELKSNNPTLWEEILSLRLKDLLNYKGDVEEKLSVYNYLIELIKQVKISLPYVSISLEKPSEETQSQLEIKQPSSQLPTVKTSMREVSPEEFVKYTVEDWESFLKSCFRDGLKIVLPRDYIKYRKSLRSFLEASINLTPEQLQVILDRVKYRYIVTLHEILYTLVVEQKTYSVLPTSSHEQFISGQDGLFQLFEAKVEQVETSEGKKKIYIITIVNNVVKICREVEYENKRVRVIRYYRV